MDLKDVIRRGPCEWEIPMQGLMKVPALIYGTESLLRDMDEKVREQAVNVACLPGIVRASYVMPDGSSIYDSSSVSDIGSTRFPLSAC